MLKINTDIDHNLEFRTETVKIAQGMLETVHNGKVVYSIKIKDIEKAYLEEGSGIAKLIIKNKSGREEEAAYFTRARVKIFRSFVDAINEYVIKDKPINKSFEEESKRSEGGIRTIYWLYGFAAKYKKLIVLSTVLSLLAVAFSLIPPYLLKILIDSVILSNTHSAVLFEQIIIVLIASYFLTTLAQVLQQYYLSILGNKIVTNLRSKAFEKAVGLPPTEVDNISASRIEARLISDTGDAQWMLTYGISIAVTSILTIIGIGVILFLLFPSLALYILLPIPPVILLILLYNKRSHKAYGKRGRKGADLITKIYDVIPNYLTVKTATKEDSEIKEFNTELGDYYDSQIEVNNIELKYWQPVGLLFALATVAIWWVGGNLVISGITQLGIITAFIAYMALFYSPLQQIINIFPYLQQGLTSSERVRELFEIADKNKESKLALRPKMEEDITFENVWFGYDPLFPILKNINAKIKKGRKTAIVGKSGSGKSTMTKLIAGLYKTTSGKLSIGKTDIKDADISYLREHIAYVPQEASFFDKSISYNVSYYSKEKPDPLMILAATKAVAMHDEVMAFPLKYDNRIKGRGVNISGGQKQRLSIARVMLSDSKIVLLDEITASLDAINARKVNKALSNIEKGKTIVTIAHDVNEIMSADFAILLENGSVIEQGKPEELIRKKGKLYKMFKYKFGDREYTRTKGEPLESFIKDLIGKEKNAKIEPGPRKSLLNLSYGGKTTNGVIPKKPFPISHPKFVIFYKGKGKEVVAFEDYSKLDENSKAILKVAIAANNLEPKIIGIKSINLTGEGLKWVLQTNAGDFKANTKYRQDLLEEDGAVILIDEFNTPIKIDLKNLDKKSIDMLRKWI
jgi:ATP-binding cassette subfamily C protein